MNASNAKDYLPFVQAMAEGKVVQRIDRFGYWDMKEESFDLAPHCYRIKPEPRKPREMWMNVYEACKRPYLTKESAELDRHGRLECVHYKEVIDES